MPASPLFHHTGAYVRFSSRKPASAHGAHALRFVDTMGLVSEPSPFTLTKIVGTIGPATADVDRLLRLVEEGLRVVRLNFSHGTLDDHAEHARIVRAAAERAGRPLAILGDLAGPKLRVRGLASEPVEVETGDLVAFDEHADTVGRDPGQGALVLGATHAAIVHDVQPGERVLIDDGRVRMLAVEQQQHDGARRLLCRVTQGGPIGARKGVNLPDTRLSLPSLTDYDWRCVSWAIEQELDYLALSFVRRHEDIVQLHDGLTRLIDDTQTGAGMTSMPIVAKIETPQALDDLESIIDVSDAVMIARGDLGVEMEPWDVPIIQKRALRSAHEAGKPVIVATQMLQSMIEHDTPTRAEVSDIANAVMDGTDAVMLSGETAVGEHPEATVRVMRHAALSAERFMAGDVQRRAGPPSKLQASRYRTAALAHGVSVVVRDLNARYVAVWSERGGGARYLSQNRLAAPILAASASPKALRRMCLMFGVEPIPMDRPSEADAFLEAIDRLVLARAWAKAGEPIIVVLGEPIGTAGVTNELRIHYVGDVCQLDDP